MNERLKKLEQRCKALEAETDLLAELSEESHLLGSISEELNASDDLDRVIERALERLSLLKDVPFCASGVLSTGGEFTIQYSYASFTTDKPSTDRIVFPEQFARAAVSGTALADGEWCRALGLDALFSPGAFAPAAALAVPLRGRFRSGRLFLFAVMDDAGRLTNMRDVLQRLSDLIASKEETLYLLKEVQRRNLELEQRVGIRTAQLAKSEELFRALFEQASDGIFFLDTKGTVVAVNEAFARLHGYTTEEMLRLGLEGLDVEGTAQVPERIRRIMAGETLTFEVEHKHKDGHFFPLEVTANLISAGEEQRIIAIHRDITERKRAEKALRESEQLLTLFIRRSPIYTYIKEVTPAESRVLYASENFQEMIGIPGSAMFGKTMAELFPPEFAAKITADDWAVVSGGQVIQLEEELNGRNYATIKSPLVQDLRTLLVGYTIDITERKRAEEALKESEEKYRRLYNETPVMLHSIDRNAVLVDVNEHWLKVMGYERGEVIGRKVTDFYTPAAAAYAREVVQPAFFRDGFVRDVSYQFVKKDGEVLDVLLSATGERDAEGIVVRSQAVIVDMTERKRAEDLLRRSEARYRMLYEGTPVMMHSIDSDGRLISVSDQWLKTLGYSRDEVLGRRTTEFLEEASAAYARNVVLPEFMRTGACSDIHYTFVKKNGEHITTLLSAIAEQDEAGRMVRSLAVIIDITARKRAEEALQTSERMLKTIIDTEPECVKLLDENACLIMMNRAGLEMLQVDSLEQVKGQCVCPLITSEYRPAFMDLTRRVFQGESGMLLFEMAGMKGRHLWLEIHAVPLRNEKNEITALLGVTRDVTERRRAEEEGRRNEARMASFYRISQYPAENEQAFLDLALNEAIALTGSAIGYLYSYDEAKREFNLSAYSRDVMKECSIADRKTCYELDKTGIWGEAVRQRQPILLNDFESDHPLKKGYPEGHAVLRKFLTVPVIMGGAVVAVVGVANKQADYTEADVLQLNLLMDSVWKMVQRARAERALQASEERFRDLAESLPLTVFEMDLQGRFTYVNRAALEKFGYSRQEFDAGLNMVQMIAPGDRDRAREIMASRLTGNTDGYREYQGLRKDGTTFPVTVASGPILRDGRPVGLRGIVSDLSERRQLEEERMKTEKLESIGTLAGGIAHDFNNLLQGIFGYISMAKLTLDRREKAIAMLEQAEQALHRSVGLTNQLLTFSKGGKPMKKALSLRPLIESTLALALSGSRAKYELSIDDDLRPVEADEGQIGQVIQNIVLNADQAMPMGGTVTVRARNVTEAESPPGRDADKRIEITLRDDGVGIPAEYLPKIFDPYFTTKEKGSGLGLATSYSIIKNHDGKISVSSEPGKGTTFTITLPAVDQAPEALPRAAAAVATRSGRVLVMDDEEVVRMVAAELLRSMGHEVELAEHGGDAVERYRRARTEGRPFDVVILDLTIRGGMGGMETMRLLREHDPSVKAIVSSGYSDDAVVSNYREYGFSAYLKKPYDLTALKAILNELIV